MIIRTRRVTVCSGPRGRTQREGLRDAQKARVGRWWERRSLARSHRTAPRRTPGYRLISERSLPRCDWLTIAWDNRTRKDFRRYSNLVGIINHHQYNNQFMSTSRPWNENYLNTWPWCPRAETGIYRVTLLLSIACWRCPDLVCQNATHGYIYEAFWIKNLTNFPYEILSRVEKSQ